MTTLESLGEVIETDVLIVGGGLSGLWAANRARDFMENVLVVDKAAPLGLAGQGYFSGGGIQALPPGHNIDDYLKDIIYLGDGLFEQDILTSILSQSYERIQDYQRMGVEFIKEVDGRLRYMPQRGLMHNACYLAAPMGSGGRDMMTGLAAEAKKRGVKYLGRTFITDLIQQQDGTVAGAVGFNTRTGQFLIFKTNAVILATGGCSFRGGYEDTHMCWGEGTALAFKAGADLKNLEFTTIWMIPKKFRWEGVTYLLPLGAKFVNEKSEEFMERYAPGLRSNCDYNYLARAMAFEAREGRGPFYLDCSAMKPEDKEVMTPVAGWTGVQYKQLLQAGIRPFDERQEWTATPWSCHHVHSDLGMRTSVPGLFVAGVMRNIDPGIYFGGWSLCKTAATGRWAAESAASYVKTKVHPEIKAAEVAELKRAAMTPLNRKGIDPEKVLHELQKTFFPNIILKIESDLQKTLQKVEVLRDELLPQMGASDLHHLVKLVGMRSMVLIAELILRASLMRTESRASHFREDYPGRDDKNWLKWIVVNQKNGKLDFHFEHLPLEKYSHKTWQCYGDNFKFPKLHT
jgi:succinate dehydrogenase / fumarate reductase, flavoprotein subunit